MVQTEIVRRHRRRHVAGVVVLLLFSSLRVAPQENTGRIDVHVKRFNSADGVAEVAITLQGPYQPVTAGELANLYKPNPALTPAMKEQVDALIASAPPNVTAEVIANAALRMESQLLGLPVPTPIPVPPTGPNQAPSQIGGLTDSSGHATFPKLAPGRYQIRAQREGYFGAPPPGSPLTTLPTIASSTVTIDAAQPTTTVDMTMVRGATVSGRVRDPNGQPLSGVQVSAHSIAYQNNREVLNTINSKTTDDRGEYRLFWLPPGDFYIGVTPRRATTNPSVQDTYARTFSGTANPRAATRVKVSEGGEATGIDIGVRADATGKISGRVVTSITLPNGQPAQATTFFLVPREGDAFADAAVMNFQNLAANRANGQFEIRGVLPGSYDLITNITTATTVPAVGRVRVDGAGSSVDNVILNVKTGVEVKAQLKLDGGAVPFTMAPPPPSRDGGIQTIVRENGVERVISELPLPAGPASTTPVPTPTYRLQLRSLEVYPSPFDAAAQQFTFDPSGMFVFPNVPEGRYYAAVTPLLPSWYIADVRVADKSVFDDGFAAGSLPGTLEVTVSSHGAKIFGVVRDAAQKPVPSSRVVLIPLSTRSQNLVLYRTATADAKGNFTVMGIAPGEYKLFAWESVPASAWMNAEFMKPYESLGKNIEVLEGATVTSDVQIIPFPK